MVTDGGFMAAASGSQRSRGLDGSSFRFMFTLSVERICGFGGKII